MNSFHDLDPEERRLAAEVRAAFEPYRLPPIQFARRRPVRIWLGTFTAVAAAVLVAALALRPPSVQATWTREPTSSELTALTDAAEEACRAQAATWQQVRAEAGWGDDPAMQEMSQLPLVAYDKRGEASAALFGDAATGAAGMCAIIPVKDQPDYVEVTASLDGIPVGFGSVSVWLSTVRSNWDYGSRGDIAGRVAPEVDELTVVLSDGQRVTATINDGWFLAWWPHWSAAVSLEVVADGAIEVINLADRYDAGDPPCRIYLFDEGMCIWSY